MYFHYDPTDTDEIDREVIAGATDVNQLLAWLEDQRAVESELVTLIASMKLADAPGTSGMARKLGYTRIACNWIMKRLDQLGHDAPDDAMPSKYRRMKHHLFIANQQHEAKNKKIKALTARVAELEAALRDKAA